MRGEPRVLTAPPNTASPIHATGFVSLINLASVRAIEDFEAARRSIPCASAAISCVEGLEPWAELGMVGAMLDGPDGLRLRLTQRTQRCAATNVDPVSGLRDLEIPWTLDARLGHRDCGVYAEVLAGGTLRAGDTLRVAA